VSKYHKIDTMFKRDMDNGGKIIFGQWAVPEIAYLAANDWAWTEKVDGTNIRIYWDAEGISYGGRTDNAQIPAALIKRLNELFYDRQSKLAEVFPDSGAILYGEGYGAKIQNGGKYKDHADFVLFDVKIDNWWLKREDVNDVAAKLGIESVPVVGYGTLYEAIDLVTSDNFKSHWGDFEAEGIVARPTTELFTRRGDRIVTKIKTRDFR